MKIIIEEIKKLNDELYIHLLEKYNHGNSNITELINNLEIEKEKLNAYPSEINDYVFKRYKKLKTLKTDLQIEKEIFSNKNKEVLTIDLRKDKTLKEIFKKYTSDFDIENKEKYVDLIFDFMEVFECFFIWKSINHNGLIIQITAYEWENFLDYLKNNLGMSRFIYNNINETNLSMQDFINMLKEKGN